MEKILVQFGKIERIVLLAHLPFSFVRFQNIERAERAAKTINNGEIGVEMHSTQTQLYASFVDASEINDVFMIHLTVVGFRVLVVPNLEVSTTNKALSGLFLHQNFVTQQEEAELIELLTSKCPDGNCPVA